MTPNEFDLTFGVPNYGATFRQNCMRIATIGEVTDRQTNTQTQVILLSGASQLVSHHTVNSSQSTHHSHNYNS